MSLSDKNWVWPQSDRNCSFELAKKLNVPHALARLLLSRGMEDFRLAGAFLCPSIDQLHSPWLMLGMDRAVTRLLNAVEEREKIIIYGDYDADGIAASVILVEALQQLGGEVDFFLPSRFEEGYGLHVEPLRQFKDSGGSLVVTVDCGINAFEEAVSASKIGLDLIITDHHQPFADVPEAKAVINPLQKGCSYPFKELSGAGIAFKLAVALMDKAGSQFPSQLLDLAALGTAADVVPLLGENRIIVSSGLEKIRGLGRPGFKALAHAVSLDKGRINSTALAFLLAPAVNAAGRMGEALPAAQLLLEGDEKRAAELAEHLQKANQLRRLTEQKILLEAEAASLELLSNKETKVITLASENWHHGVIGIVASRLVDKFNCPVVLIACEEGTGRGSARSIEGFDITAALADSASLLKHFGGHEHAAGFTIEESNIDRLRRNMNSYARGIIDESRAKPVLSIDVELDASEINLDLAGNIEQLQPFGAANPVPLFGSRDWEITSLRLVGADKKHLKLVVKKGKQLLEPIMFAGAGLEAQLEKGRRVDLAFRLKNSFYRDQERLEVEVKDLSYSEILSGERVETVDLRGSKKRLEIAQEILRRENRDVIVFSATFSRAGKITENTLACKPPSMITSGVMNGGSANLPGEAAALVLYDLPLHENIIEQIFKKGPQNDKLTVYLLYNQKDQAMNTRLIDMSLPSAEMLETIIAFLLTKASEGSLSALPEDAIGALSFKPVKTFWERVETILTEISLLKNGRLSADSTAIMKNWPECLEHSPTYSSTRELIESCERFQKLLLGGSLQEVTVFFDHLSDR